MSTFSTCQSVTRAEQSTQGAMSMVYLPAVIKSKERRPMRAVVFKGAEINGEKGRKEISKLNT